MPRSLPAPWADRRQALAAFGVALTGLSLGVGVDTDAHAEERWPTRPITLILPYAPGGATDIIARVFAQMIGQRLGGSVAVVNKPGAGGNIATDAVAIARPDGYTLLMGNQGPMVVNPHLYKALVNDPAEKLEPISLMAESALALVVGPRLKVNSAADFVRAAKAEPGRITYASASVASASHLAMVVFEQATGIKGLHIPYRGSGPALQDVVKGDVDCMISVIPSVTGFLAQGQLKALAVTSAERIDVLPDVPTLAEAGLPGVDVAAWYGLLAPKGLPAAIRLRLETATAEVMRQPEMLARLRDDGSRPKVLGAAGFAAFLAAERQRWGAIVASLGIKADE